MNEPIFGMEDLDGYIFLGIVIFFSLIETIATFLTAKKRTFEDWIVGFSGAKAVAGILSAK